MCMWRNIYPDFRPQGRRHQKSMTVMSMAIQKGLISTHISYFRYQHELAFHAFATNQSRFEQRLFLSVLKETAIPHPIKFLIQAVMADSCGIFAHNFSAFANLNSHVFQFTWPFPFAWGNQKSLLLSSPSPRSLTVPLGGPVW